MNKDFLKEFATAFFYKWYNSPGTNTEEGFESWYDTEEAQSIIRKHGVNTHVSRSVYDIVYSSIGKDYAVKVKGTDKDDALLKFYRDYHYVDAVHSITEAE